MRLWRTPQWLASSVRNKLLAMALLPLLVAFPLLVLVLVLWGNSAYDRLLTTKVRSDLAVARGYFDRVLVEALFARRPTDRKCRDRQERSRAPHAGRAR